MIMLDVRNDMVEIAPHCYLNRAAYDAGIHNKPVARNVEGQAMPAVPIGNSLVPWREWLRDGDIAKRNWNGRLSIDRLITRIEQFNIRLRKELGAKAASGLVISWRRF